MNKIIDKRDERYNLIYHKNSVGCEFWWEYDENNNEIYHKYRTYEHDHIYERWIEYNNGKMICLKDSDKYGCRWEYDKNNRVIHEKDTSGQEFWWEYREGIRINITKEQEFIKRKYVSRFELIEIS